MKKGDSEEIRARSIRESDRAEEKFGVLTARRIRVAEWKVLLALAYDGPQSMYAISKKNKMKYPVVHRVTKDLEKIEWIRIVEKRRSEKNVDVKIYSLTSEGLLWIFSRIPRKIPYSLIGPSRENGHGLGKSASARRFESVESTELEDLSNQEGVYLHLVFDFDVNRIALKNTDLFPLVFMNWNAKKKTDLTGDLSFVFTEAAFSALWEYYHDFRGLRTRLGSLEKLFAYESYRALLEHLGKTWVHLGLEVKERSMNEIRTLYESDPQLRELLDMIVSELQGQLKENLAFLAEVKAAQATKNS